MTDPYDAWPPPLDGNRLSAEEIGCAVEREIARDQRVTVLFDAPGVSRPVAEPAPAPPLAEPESLTDKIARLFGIPL